MAVAQKNAGDCGEVTSERKTTTDNEDLQNIDAVMASAAAGPSSDAGLRDGIGVPYYDDTNPKSRRFLHHFFVPKVVQQGLSGYSLRMTTGGRAEYHLELKEEEQYTYPPFTFDRRLTMNNWRTLLTEAMLLAGLRLAALQANLQSIMAMMSNPIYGNVPFAFKIAWLAALFVAFVLWFLLAANRAYKYSDFVHPDTKLKRLMAISSSAILVMFAIPNDVVLLPIHALPMELGGLLAESACIENNWRWPVLTLAHSSKPDHDYTNWAGVSIQLPLFWIVDLGCTCLNIIISTKYGILNYTALIQMCLCSLYALHKIYVAYERYTLRQSLFMIWRKTACDPNMSLPRQKAAMNKYVAEGGNPAFLERKMMLSQSVEEDPKGVKVESNGGGGDRKRSHASMQRLESKASLLLDSGDDIMDREDTIDLVGDKSGVPWFKPGESATPKLRQFIHTYYVPKEKSAEGGYTVKKKADGSMDYTETQTPESVMEYPPATYDRRVTQNNWQEMLTMCMLEAGLRNAGLQANVMMAILMLENPQYNDMPYELWIAFVVQLFLGLSLWAAYGMKRACRHLEFVHPDTKYKRCLAVGSSALLMMFAMPNDVVLFPIHLLPMSKGGLLCESGLVDGCSMWPVHNIAHYSKADHDFINTNDANTQLPLFVFIDIGCTITNLVIALKLGVFNFTALLQMCTCGAYAFVKLREMFLRYRLRKTLLNLWMRTAMDTQMSESRREAAKSKYQLIGGNKKKLQEELHSEGKIRISTAASHDPH